MLLSELYGDESKLSIPRSEYIQQKIASDPAWKKLGYGAMGAVYKAKQDKNTVVKVYGAGMGEQGWRNNRERNTDLAFIDFCVHEGLRAHPEDDWRKHYPNILDINMEDDHVLQVKLERLNDFSVKQDDLLRSHLGNIEMLFRKTSDSYSQAQYEQKLDALLKEFNLQSKNSAKSIITAVKNLFAKRSYYAKANNAAQIRLDLHSGNWLLRKNGEIVAADPWIG